MTHEIEVAFRRPKYTSAVKGEPRVGLTGDGKYAVECVYGDVAGYGDGDTPGDARRASRANLDYLLRHVY